MKLVAFSLLPFLILLMPYPLMMPPSNLNSSFGTGGIVTTGFGGVNAEINALSVTSTGKLVASGGSFDLPNWDFALAQYLPNGSLDPSFGDGGKVVTSFGNMATIFAMAIQPDHKIKLSLQVLYGSVPAILLSLWPVIRPMES